MDGCLRSWNEDWHAICQAFFQGVEGSEWENMYHKYKELHQAVTCKKSGQNKEAKALWSLKEAENRGIYFLRSGQRAEDQDKIPNKVGSLGIPPEEPDGCSGRRTERTEKNVGPPIHEQRAEPSLPPSSGCRAAVNIHRVDSPKVF